MSKRKGGGNKNGEETPPMEILASVYPKRFLMYGIPINKQFQERINNHLDEDMDLEQLHLWDDAGPNAVKAIIESVKLAEIPTLKSIRFWKVNCQDEGVRILSTFLSENKTVVILDLLNNRITPLGCDFLGTALHPACNKTLQKLMLDHNNIGSEGMDNLARGIAMSPTLTSLSLSYCSLDKNSATSLQLIIVFIESQLNYLNLEGNFLESEGVGKIMKAMRLNTSIKELNLADNKFTDENLVMSEFVDALKDNETLTMLNLEYNEIFQEGTHIINKGAQKLLEIIVEFKRCKIELTNRFTEDFINEYNLAMKGVKGKKKGKAKKGKKNK